MTRLTAIETQIVDEHLVIPHGLKPVYFHRLDGKLIAYVSGWSGEKEYDNRYCDLYQLSAARQFTVQISGEDQFWYDTFGEPTKEAMKLPDGTLNIRER